MSKELYYNKEILGLFRNLARFNKTNFRFLYQLIKIIRYQRKAYNRRLSSKTNGIQVPPIVILSITKNCNLNCKGCYQKAQDRKSSNEMTEEKIISVFKEANDLGSSVVIFLGGEPFTRKDIFRITENFKNMVFGVFTNGLLVDNDIILKFKKNRHVVPIISLEGAECETDERRGEGVYSNAQKLISELKKNNIVYGISHTVTSKNYELITNETYIGNLIKAGCMFFFFIDYVPVTSCNNELLLNKEQQKKVKDFYLSFREKYRSPIMAPAIEETAGGCFGAGRGLIHINYDGSIEPCPFAPISECSVFDTSFKDALKSDFLLQIRNNHEKLESNNTGSCTLWENRELVESYKNN